MLFVIGELLYLGVGMSPSAEDWASGLSIFQGMLFLLGAVLLAGGLVGLYADRKDDLGVLGAAGFIIAFVGTVLTAGNYWDSAFAVPALAKEAPALVEAGPPPLVMFGVVASLALLAIGWVLLGLAFLRSRVYPRWAAMLLMVGAVLAFLPLPFSTIPFGAAVAWIGMLSLSPSGRGASAERPSRVS